MTLPLFDLDAGLAPPAGSRERLGPGSVILRGFALAGDDALLAAVAAVMTEAPPRRMATAGGRRMSAALTSAGALGWVSDEAGYRYAAIDPSRGKPWPLMPAVFRALAKGAAHAAGYEGFAPDACLVNVYVPGARMGMHQDRDERDLDAPIVSVSLGLSAIFAFGGHERADAAMRYRLFHGDVVVWGGPDRLRFHGVAPLEAGEHSKVGPRRLNLTFSKVK